MSQANIDVRVMDGVSCENAFVGTRRAKWKQHQKDAQWVEKSLWACVGRVMLVAETLLFFF